MQNKGSRRSDLGFSFQHGGLVLCAMPMGSVFNIDIISHSAVLSPQLTSWRKFPTNACTAGWSLTKKKLVVINKNDF